MAVKHYLDEIPPTTGREYEITTSGRKSKIKDVTSYDQVGSGFGAADVNATCILECNYSKEGTVHLLTTDNVWTENIKFYTTFDYNSGDTFKFNGTPVVAKTTDGQALCSKFFVANTIVECKKKGTTLYFAGSSRFIEDDNTKVNYRLGIENGMLYVEEG